MSDNIDQLESKFFYLGGGAVDLKISNIIFNYLILLYLIIIYYLGIGIEEFKNKYESKIFIGDIVYK